MSIGRLFGADGPKLSVCRSDDAGSSARASGTDVPFPSGAGGRRKIFGSPPA
jgi:hypothetical protein